MLGQKEGANQIDPPYEKGRDWELKGTHEESIYFFCQVESYTEAPRIVCRSRGNSKHNNKKEYYELLVKTGAKMAGMAKAITMV